MTNTYTFPVGASALTRYQAVKTASGLVVTAATTDEAIGIVEDGYDANATAASVVTSGRTKAIASAAIAAGAVIMPNASGQVTTWTTTNTRFGRALSAASAAGDIIEIEVFADKGILAV